MPDDTRAATVRVALDATPEDVWEALTNPHELTRWFPVSAEVDARVGGIVAWRWDDQFSMVSRIDALDPPRRLRLVQDREVPHGADGSNLGGETPARVVMDFTIETSQGRTELRVVHSGFGHGQAWDDELEGVTNGWNFELRCLAHYLACHRGRTRSHGWATTTTHLAPSTVWELLTGPAGFGIPLEAREPGAMFELTVPGAGTLPGTSRWHLPIHEWFGTTPALDNGIIRLSTWRGGGRTGVNVWFATWSPGLAERAAALGRAAQTWLNAHVASGAQDATRRTHDDR